MKILHKRIVLPAIFIIVSFLCLALLAMFTNPLTNIACAVAFYAALVVFVASLGYTIRLIQVGQVSRKSRERILGVSIFLVVLLMFRSVGSLSWVGGLILLLLAGGWLFYVSRRA